MGLKDLFNKHVGKAKSWLGTRTEARPTLHTDAIRHDRFDAAVFEQMCQEAPALANMVEDLRYNNPHTPDMVRDVMMQFWQADPRLRQRGEMDTSRLRNHAVASDVETAPETATTRSFTKHDRYGATMATLGVAERVKRFLGEQDELRKAQEEADQKRQEEEQAAEDANAAADAASQASGDYDGEGPMTQAQAEALEALEAALEAAQAAADASQQAQAQAQAAAAQATSKMAGSVREAVKEAGDKLAAEAELMRAWGVHDGDLKKLSFEERAALARRLSSGRLAKYAKLIGQRRVAAAAMRNKRTEYGRDEVVGVEMSNDVSRVIESEWATSRSRAMRLDFLSRFAEGQLLSRRFVGIEKIRAGSIVALCDNSGSMGSAKVAGITREAWAKATMLSLLDQARAEKRDFVWINFSSTNQVRAWYFPKGEGSLDEVLEAVEQFYDGGTNFERPLELAMDILEANPTLKGDVVLITDDDCRVTPDWLKSYQARKARLAFRTFGIAIGFQFRQGGTLDNLSDNTRSVVEFSDPNDIADLVRVL